MVMSGRARAWAMAILLAAGGCGSAEFVFRPTEQVTATTDGYPTARYPVPPESPRGTVYVTSFGFTQADLWHTGQRTLLLHLRLTASNDGGTQAWTVDTREQLIQIPGFGLSGPTLVNSEPVAGAVVTVPAAQKRTIDLYYAPPATVASPEKLPPFDLLWKVQTDQRLVAQRTPFEKDKIEPLASAYNSPVVLDVGWGPFWWYDPFYPGIAFYPPVIINRVYPRVVAQPPRAVAASPWRGQPPPPVRHR
jgi:hypothetical protein